MSESPPALGRRLAAAAIAALALGACATRVVAPPRIPDEARTATRIPEIRRFCRARGPCPAAPVFRWSAGQVPVTSRLAIPLFPAYRRLMVCASDGVANDVLLLDTGSSASLLSMASPLARSMRFSEKPRRAGVVGPPLHAGGRAAVSTRVTETEVGVIESLRLGDTVVGREVPLHASSERGSRANPASILGLDLLQAAALVHEGGDWIIETGPRKAWPAASTVSLAAIGLPIVTFREAGGAEVRVLVDTGAPYCVAYATAGTPPYTLTAADGREVLRVEKVHDGGCVDGEELLFAGIHIDLILGIDAIDRDTWRIDFERGVWEFAR